MGIKLSSRSRIRCLDDFDLVIAAHALDASAILVTSNVRCLSRVPGLEVEDWERG